MRKTFVLATTASLVGVMFLLSGCQSTGKVNKSEMPKQPLHVAMKCLDCYDRARAYQMQVEDPTEHGQIIRAERRLCEDCVGKVTTYVKDGNAMIECPYCAPEGVACEKILAPGTYFWDH